MGPRTYVRPKQYRFKKTSAQEILARKKLKSMANKKKNPVSNSKAIATLAKDVKALKVAEFGQKQISRQICRSSASLPDDQAARVSAAFPIAFCHQAIDLNTQLYQVQLEPITGNVITDPIAVWRSQPFPLTQPPIGDGTSVKFDQLKWLQSNSIGLQPGYYHHSTTYNMKFNAVNWRGWVDVLVVSTRRQFTRQASPDIDEFQLPVGLAGFSNSCGGTPDQYSWNPLFYGVKRIKRMYFNTAINAGERALYTNPDKFCSFKIMNQKSRAHIRAQTNAEYQVPPAAPATPITHLDIPLRQQDWIVVTSSNENRPNANSYCAVNITRVPVWRDTAGSS